MDDWITICFPPNLQSPMQLCLVGTTHHWQSEYRSRMFHHRLLNAYLGVQCVMN